MTNIPIIGVPPTAPQTIPVPKDWLLRLLILSEPVESTNKAMQLRGLTVPVEISDLLEHINKAKTFKVSSLQNPANSAKI